MRFVLLLAVALIQTACVRSYATRALADALSGSGGSYGQDDDPELIEGAIPFGLKTMESLLAEQPEHKGLLTSLAAGFVSYAYAYVELPADEIADSNIDRALEMRRRARKLYLRARDYALRGLEVAHPSFKRLYGEDPEKALQNAKKEDVPLLYWTAASWGLAIGASKDDPEVIADFPEVARYARRALALDESWNKGSIHEFFITFETAAPDGSLERAREHFSRAIELSEGKRAGPFVTLAEKVSVKQQKVKEFRELLEKALAVDVKEASPDRLANVLVQRRARRLLKVESDLFLGEEDAGGAGDEGKKP